MQKLVTKYRELPVQVRASLWFLICSFLQKGISVITTPIFTRLLTTTEYGQYNVFNSWLSILTIFVTLNLSMGVYNQALVKFEEDRAKLSSSLQGFNFVLSLLWTGIYLLFHNFWNELFHLTTVQMLAMMVLIWSTSVFNFWAAEQRVTFSYRRLVLLTIIVSLAKPIVGIVLVVHAEDKVTARILGLALVELIGYSALFFVQLLRGKQFFSKRYWLYSLGFNLPLLPHYLSQTVLNSSDRIMIERMVGGSEAGIYSLAYSLALLMTMVNTALMNTVSPWIYQKIKAKKIDDISGVAYITLGVIAVANIALIAFAPEAVRIFAPKSYYDAIYVIPPVAMSVFFMYCYDLFAKFEFYFEKTNYVMIASIIGAILNIILNFVFIRIFGYYAAGYTTLFCYILYAILHYLFMRKVCRDNLDGAMVYDPKTLLMITVLFMVIGFIYLFTYQSIIARYSLTAFLLVIMLFKRTEIIESINKVIKVREKKQG